MKGENLPQILKQDNRVIKPTEGKGFSLIESVQVSMAEDYDIFMSCEDIIDLVAIQLVEDPEYLKYSKRPLTQADVNAAVKFGTSTRSYGRLVSDIYIPALATALQIHFRIIANIHGYYTIIHSTPLKTFENSQCKVINFLLDDDEKYQPIVYLKPHQQASTITSTLMSQTGEDSTTNGTNNLATPEHQQVQDKSEIEPLDEPEVPTIVEIPVASQCCKVTEDLDALSIDLKEEITAIPKTQLSQIPRNINAESTSDTNVHTTMEEPSSPEDTFPRGIDSTLTQLNNAASVATST